MIATLGVSDLIVVDTADAVLVCRRDRAQDIKKLTELLRERGHVGPRVSDRFLFSADAAGRKEYSGARHPHGAQGVVDAWTRVNGLTPPWRGPGREAHSW